MKKLIICLLLLTALAGCGDTQPVNNNISTAENCTVVIFHINDMHGKIDNLPRLAWLIQQYKVTNSYVTAVSGGDGFSGNPAVDQYEPPGYPMIDLLEQCGFTVSVIGNHEFDYGQTALNNRMEQNSIRFISANMDCSSAVLQ